ncbi:glucose 1-dehydrogenase [Zavarzinia compransoris]|uniref:glucose 1-dehydrogenase n=1 Tax=Zavarzinia marina TaxID=2911065 RepID=UPI001F2F4CB7|nr:glucose 1-dehydrogenase [Zavarzinia marina]MCF4166008.1 glucose 1-dehydrogenase [Zavarzinia marina]
MGRVAGKIALVTGAAKGIGREAALVLAREGAAVAVTDLDEEAGRKVVAEITAAGGKALFRRQDVADEAAWEATIAALVAAFGGLDILVNNAGVALAGSVEDTSLEDWRWLMSINLDGVFLGTKHAIKAMKARGGGSIVNLSSIEGIIGDANLAAYNASKGGVRIFTKSAALHCAQAGYGIRVNSVHPGYIWTPMVEGYLDGTEDPAAGKEGLIALHPIGHLGVAADIANGILYLASDESAFMTGSELVIDGGYTAR